MNFEICIQGPKAEIITLFKRLKPFSPRFRRVIDRSDEETFDRLEVVVKRSLDPSLLDRELLSVSNLMTASGGEGLLEMRVRNLDYSEPPSGSDGFLESFRPIASLLVEPWSPRTGGRIKKDRIYLDPGHAFGTGKHPTTLLCLKILESLIQMGLPIKRALDFGCGTGILAMAAVRLGVERALGVEVDSASVKTARRNVRLNRLEQRIEICEGSWEAVKGPFDLVLANLVVSALLRIGGPIADQLADHGWAVVSGFGPNQMEEVLPVLERSGLVLHSRYGLNGWAGCLLGKAHATESGGVRPIDSR